MSNDFEIERVDLLGARASRDKGIGAEFPQRVETNTDLNYYDKAKTIDTQLNFGSPSSIIYEVKRKLYEEDLTLLVRSNAYFGKVKKGIQRNANRRQKCARMLALSFKEDTKMTPALNDRILKLQEGFEIVGIYDGYNLTPAALREQIKASVKMMAELGIKPKRVNVRIPTILQKPEILREKIAIAFSETNGVALKHAAFGRAKRQYRVIRSFGEHGGWTHMYDMRGVWTGNDRTSLMHIAQLLSIDSFGLRTGKKPPENIPPITPKRLDIGTLGTLTAQEHSQRYGHDLFCGCYVCAGKTMEDMQQDYSPEERYPIFRSHLPYAANFEFGFDRQAILQEGNTLLNRLRKKEFMAEPFKHIFNTDINNRAFQPKLF